MRERAGAYVDSFDRPGPQLQGSTRASHDNVLIDRQGRLRVVFDYLVNRKIVVRVYPLPGRVAMIQPYARVAGYDSIGGACLSLVIRPQLWCGDDIWHLDDGDLQTVRGVTVLVGNAPLIGSRL